MGLGNRYQFHDFTKECDRRGGANTYRLYISAIRFRVFSTLRNEMRNWYRGVYVPPPVNDPDSLVVVISAGYFEQPPLAKLLRELVKFWRRNWQWTITTALAIFGVVLVIF